jgi:UDP-N-acetylmuramate--alanine ligase
MQSIGTIENHNGMIEVIDDYGHHPVEIEAVADALSTHCKQKQLITIFQPHRFSRTLNHFENFAIALGKHTNKLFLMEIYPASEKPIKGITSEALARLIKEKYGINVEILPKDPTTILEKINMVAKNGDIVLFQGAGDVSKLAHETVSLSKKA